MSAIAPIATKLTRRDELARFARRRDSPKNSWCHVLRPPSQLLSSLSSIFLARFWRSRARLPPRAAFDSQEGPGDANTRDAAAHPGISRQFFAALLPSWLPTRC